MNPDTTSPDYQRMVADQHKHRAARAANDARLHAAAVTRRKKRKRGGHK